MDTQETKHVETVTPPVTVAPAPTAHVPVALKASATNGLLVPIAIVVAGVLIAGAVLFQPQTGKTPDTTATKTVEQQPTTVPVDVAKVKIDTSAFAGKADAPVTVVVWSDYQCPFCKRFDQDALNQLVTDYVKTGKVKLVFKDFVFLGPDSDDAGLIAKAVWEVAPEKFLQWHTAMFAKQDAENSGWGSKEDVLALTKSLGIDTAKVEKLIADKATVYQAQMDADQAEAKTFGITGTPGTIIGTQMLSGAQPYSAVKQLVDAQLQK